MGISPLDPQTMYSALLAEAALLGTLLPLSQTAVPRQIHPAHWRASVAAGSCRQSMNMHTGAPGFTDLAGVIEPFGGPASQDR